MKKRLPQHFKKGEKRPPNAGRRAGTPNKLTKLRELLHLALQRAVKGKEGEDAALEYLTRLAKRKSPSLFVSLLAKTVEKQVSVDVAQETTVIVRNYSGLSAQQVAELSRGGKLGESVIRQLARERADGEKT